MRKRFSLTQCLALSVALTSACGAYSQDNASYTTMGMGGTYQDLLSPPLPGGGAPAVSSVESFVPADAGALSEAGSSVVAGPMTAEVSGTPTGSPGERGAGAIFAFPKLTSSLTRREVTRMRTSSSLGSSGTKALAGSYFGLPSGNRAANKFHTGHTGAGAGRPAAFLSSSTGQALLFEFGSVGKSEENSTPRLNDEQRGELSALPAMFDSDISAADYTYAFPDSTKNNAMINPPDLGNNIFAFQPVVAAGFPDLADREFLRPTFRVGTRNLIRDQRREDLYQRIENRLQAYRETSAKPSGLKNGLKQEKLSGPTLQNPLERQKLQRELKSKSNLGIEPSLRSGTGLGNER